MTGRGVEGEGLVCRGAGVGGGGEVRDTLDPPPNAWVVSSSSRFTAWCPEACVLLVRRSADGGGEKRLGQIVG